MSEMKGAMYNPSNDTQWIIWAIFAAANCIIFAMELIARQSNQPVDIRGYGVILPLKRSEWRAAREADDAES